MKFTRLFQLKFDQIRVLIAKGFKVKYNSTVLDHVNQTINRGERVGLVGHNGSGKMTMLSVIGGVYRRFSGDVKVRGRISMMLALGARFCPWFDSRFKMVVASDACLDQDEQLAFYQKVTEGSF